MAKATGNTFHIWHSELFLNLVNIYLQSIGCICVLINEKWDNKPNEKLNYKLNEKLNIEWQIKW